MPFGVQPATIKLPVDPNKLLFLTYHMHDNGIQTLVLNGTMRRLKGIVRHRVTERFTDTIWIYTGVYVLTVSGICRIHEDWQRIKNGRSRPSTINQRDLSRQRPVKERNFRLDASRCILITTTTLTRANSLTWYTPGAKLSALLMWYPGSFNSQTVAIEILDNRLHLGNSSIDM